MNQITKEWLNSLTEEERNKHQGEHDALMKRIHEAEKQGFKTIWIGVKKERKIA